MQILFIIGVIVYAGIQFFKMLLDVANGMGKRLNAEPGRWRPPLMQPCVIVTQAGGKPG